MAIIRDGKLLGKYHYAFVIMICCCLVQAFGMGLILNCGSLFYVPVCEDMGFLRSEISTYMTGYFIGTTLVTPIAGKILTKYNIRVVMSIAITILAASVASMALGGVLVHWQIAGFFVGAAGSCIFVLPSATLVGNWFIKRRGFIYGIVMACSSISAAVFSQVISLIILNIGWRAAYAFVGIAAFAVILPAVQLLRKKPSDIGTVPYGYVPEDEEDHSLPNMRGVSVKRAVFSIAFWCLFIFAGIASFIRGGIEQHMPGYIESIGFTASFAALIVSAQSVGSVFDKFLMGWLNDKIGVQRTTMIELVVIALGIIGFITLDNPVLLAISAIMFGVQDSLMSVSLPLLIREIFGSRNYTQIHAWIRTGVGLFGSFSGVLVGMSYDSLGSFVPAFVALIGTCVFAMGCVALAYWDKRKLVWTTDADAQAVTKAVLEENGLPQR